MGARVYTFPGLVAVAVFFWAETAWAGMAGPPTLTELARMRLETLSFFLMVLLGSAAIIRLIWNGLRSSFPRLPRMTYLRALGLMALWSLLFLLILLMVASARELLTPGAWEKGNVTYRLKDGGK